MEDRESLPWRNPDHELYSTCPSKKMCQNKVIHWTVNTILGLSYPAYFQHRSQYFFPSFSYIPIMNFTPEKGMQVQKTQSKQAIKYWTLPKDPCASSEECQEKCRALPADSPNNHTRESKSLAEKRLFLFHRSPAIYVSLKPVKSCH